MTLLSSEKNILLNFNFYNSLNLIHMKNEKLKVETGTSLGFVAQELEKVVPDAVVHTINGKNKEIGREPYERESSSLRFKVIQ